MDPPKVLEKALAILELFSEREPEWLEKDVSRRLHIPSSTTNRLLRGLEQSRYVTRSGDGRYRLGVGALQLGGRAAGSLFELNAVVLSTIADVARETDETVVLAAPDHETQRAVFIFAVESTQRVRVVVQVGSSVPLSAGATAKALLAFLPESVFSAVLASPGERLASGTILEPDAIRREIHRIRKRGWASSREEAYQDTWAVAAPLIGIEGWAIGSIGVAVPMTRYSSAAEALLSTTITDAASKASPSGWRPFAHRSAVAAED